MHRVITLIVLALAGGCQSSRTALPVPDASPPPSCLRDRNIDKSDVAYDSNLCVPTAVSRNIDVLFVVDNSLTMAPAQMALVSGLGGFVDVLENMEGGLPNVHIGVVSSDVGVGGNNVSGCAGAGDSGILQSAPSLNQPGCPVPGGRYIADLEAGTGGRVRNYVGTLADNLRCIAEIGTSGCGFEQHFESMKRALDGSNPENTGFLRPDAFLAVVFVADEDDCSASNTDVFDTTPMGISGPLGPLSSFRCFEFGVTCDGGLITRSAATYSSCEPRSNSPYIHHASHYVDFLKGLKADPYDIIVAGIVADPQPVSVSLGQTGFPQVDPACQSATGMATPGVRFSWLFDQFSYRALTSICNNDLSGALIRIAELVARAIGGRCLKDTIDQTDLFPNEAGLQLDCQVSDVTRPNQWDQTETPLPRCKMTDDVTPDRNASSLPCWWVGQNPAECPHTSNGLLLTVERDVGPPAGTQVVSKCWPQI